MKKMDNRTSVQYTLPHLEKSMIMTPYRWKREQVRKMLAMIEKRDCIWNINHSDYHNKTQRQAAFEEIESKMQISVPELKKKLHTLRAQHSKERSKMNTFINGRRVYRTKWEFFNVMKFMYRHTKKAKTMDSTSGETDDAVTVEDDSDANSQQFEQLSDEEQPETEPVIRSSKQATLLPEPVHLSSARKPITTQRWAPENNIEPQEQVAPNPCTTIFTQQRQRRAAVNDIEMKDQAASNSCMSFLTQPKPKDDFSIFGDYVGNELRLLSQSPGVQMKLKYDIQQLILNANYENLPSQYRSKSKKNNRRVSSRSPHTSSSTHTTDRGIHPNWESGEDSDISNDFSIKKSMSPHDSQDPLYY